MHAPMHMPANEMAAPSGDIAADIAMARALVQRLHAAGRRSTAELLHELRRAFPDAPLAVRVGALQALPGR
jgi:NaMN:DMB phosphoribosyltransferase